MSNVARDTLWPIRSDLSLRIAILYVGQGSSAVILAREGASFKVLLHDINHDVALGGTNVSELMSDLLDGEPLDVFVNSHPHNDHLRGLDKLRDIVTVNAIWHSGHIPSDDHEDVYAVLSDALADLLDEGREIEEIDSSRESCKIGDVECYMVAPAQHVQDDINAVPEQRDDRIHEHCVVMRMGVGGSWVILPGDADLEAWRDNILEYWTSDDRSVGANVLVAPHHGSRSFFVEHDDDEPYLEALKAINPKYVIISAPSREDSPHGHPHEAAVALYEDHVGQSGVLHTGENKCCFVVDVFENGAIDVWSDNGILAEEYPLSGDEGDEGNRFKAPNDPDGPSVLKPRKRDISEAPPFA